MFKQQSYVLLLLLIMASLNSYSQNTYHISNEIKGAKGHKFYLLNLYGGLNNRDKVAPIDSIISGADTFSFWGSFDERQFYSIAMDSSKAFIPFIIDTGKILILGNADSFPSFRVGNSWENDKFRSFSISTNPIIIEMNKHAFDSNTQQQYSILNVYLDSILAFTKRDPNNYGIFHSATAIQLFEDQFIPFGKKWYPLLSVQLKNSTEGKQIAYLIYNYNKDSLIGKPFPTLQTFTTRKKKTILKLNPKNIYLIDYWASWCIPCAEKIPALKKLYKAHKSEGLKIASLSLDLNYDAWIKAVKKCEIPWENYCSLSGMQAKDTKYFNVSEIPFTILVGKDNKILKMNPTEDEVEEYLRSNKKH